MLILAPFINEKFTGDIWRMEIDEISGTIFLETRNTDERQVSFSSLNLITGETYFKNLRLAEPWLTGIEGAYNNVLLLHHYQLGTVPVHKGITAIDALTGETLWANFNYAFDYLSTRGPVIYDIRIQPRKFYLLDIQTGNIESIGKNNVLNELKKNIIIPDLVPPDFISSDFKLLKPFGNEAHFLEFHSFRIISLHTSKGGSLNQFLYIFEGFNKLYEDLLTENVQKLQPESFIMHKDRLIYIKNKSELKVLTL